MSLSCGLFVTPACTEFVNYVGSYRCLSCVGRALQALILSAEEQDRILPLFSPFRYSLESREELRAEADDVEKAYMYVLNYTMHLQESLNKKRLLLCAGYL